MNLIVFHFDFRSYGPAKTDDLFNMLLEDDNENQFPIFPSAVQGYCHSYQVNFLGRHYITIFYIVAELRLLNSQVERVGLLILNCWWWLRDTMATNSSRLKTLLSLDSVRTISTGGFHPEMANVSSSCCKVWWRWQGGRLSWKWTSPHRLPFVRRSGDSRNAHLRNPQDNVFGIRKMQHVLINTVFIGFE